MEYYILTAALAIFLIRTVVFFTGSVVERRKNDKLRQADYCPFVSVVIPARNEEKNIARCLDSLARNNYSGRCEIIVINDRSDDSTASILEEYCGRMANLRVVTVTEDSDRKNLRGKPGALQAGIDQAEGEIILMTDADCVVPEQWIEYMVKPYSDGRTGLVAAYSITGTGRIFDKFQAIYWIYLHVMGSAGFGLKMPLGCIGNNLSVRTDVFRQLGGYSRIKFSVTEDLSLLLAVTALGRKVHYLSFPQTTVETIPSRNIRAFLSQLHRWSIGGLELGWKAAMFVTSSVALWLGIISSLVFCEPWWLLGLFCVKIFGDMALIGPGLVSVKRHSLLLWAPFAILQFFILELFVPIQLLDRRVIWKGQIFRSY